MQDDRTKRGQEVKPRVLPLVILSLFLAFLMLAYILASWNESRARIFVETINGLVSGQLYPDWFFQLLFILMIVTSSALLLVFEGRSHVTNATDSAFKSPRTTNAWPSIRGLVPIDRMDFIGHALSSLALVSAVFFVGLLVESIALHGPAALSDLVEPVPGFGIQGSSVLIYGILYVAVLWPRFRDKAIWVLGLMWGFSECVWNPESLVVYPGVLNPLMMSSAWWAYIGAVSALFVGSILILRHDIRVTKLTLALVFVVLMSTPLQAAIWNVAPVQIPYSLGNIPGHVIIITAGLLLVRRETG